MESPLRKRAFVTLYLKQILSNQRLILGALAPSQEPEKGGARRELLWGLCEIIAVSGLVSSDPEIVAAIIIVANVSL